MNEWNRSKTQSERGELRCVRLKRWHYKDHLLHDQDELSHATRYPI